MGCLFVGLICYIIIVFCYSYWLYSKSSIFFKPLTYQKDKNSEPIDIHKKYEEFKIKEKLSFLHIFLGSLFIVSIRLPLIIIFTLVMTYQLKKAISNKSPETDKETRKNVINIVSSWTIFLFKIAGIYVHDTQLPHEEVYKKYLGEDYKCDINDDNYSLIISNHIGFYEVVYYMIRFTPGFIAKREIKDYYFIGPMAMGLNCLFVRRESAEARKQILEKRQKAYYNKEILTPLLLFPEGTTTAGRNILKFKRGAFAACLPIKPVIMHIDKKADFGLACELPVIRPTEYMYETYKDLGKEKWEIFAEVVRRMYCEIGGFVSSDKGLSDSMKYIKCMKAGKYIEDEKDTNEKETKKTN